MPELETLFNVAEIAVAIAGFSAIVVLFRRRDAGTWDPLDGDRFNGMILHALVALVFCLLPPVLAAFVPAPSSVWALSSGALALATLAQTLLVLGLATANLVSRVAISGGVPVAIVVGLNALGVGFDRSFPPYLLGVIWHLLSAAVLFGVLVWVDRGQMDGPERD